MKTSAIRRSPAAFTLIEVLTVVSIVAILATMTFAAMQFAQRKSKEKQTVGVINDIMRALDEYKGDRGSYPRPAVDKKDEEAKIGDESWVVGPAKTIYQAVSGDGTDAIRNGEKASTGEQGSAQDEKDPSLGKIYMGSAIAPNKKQIQDKVKLDLVEADGETYYLIDPWRHPYRYQIVDLDKNGLPVEGATMHSASTLEIWSYGVLKKPEETEKAKRQWVKSWAPN
jgi:prepilin-type N-terminal cleavage/methylation domain-containing protein